MVLGFFELPKRHFGIFVKNVGMSRGRGENQNNFTVDMIPVRVSIASRYRVDSCNTSQCRTRGLSNQPLVSSLLAPCWSNSLAVRQVRWCAASRSDPRAPELCIVGSWQAGATGRFVPMLCLMPRALAAKTHRQTGDSYTRRDYFSSYQGCTLTRLILEKVWQYSILVWKIYLIDRPGTALASA